MILILNFYIFVVIINHHNIYNNIFDYCKMREFENIGLRKNEIRIYLELLKIGSSTAGKITEVTGIHRRMVYDILDRLIEKGLISYIIKQNIRYYSAANPEKIKDYLKEKEDKIREDIKNINKIIPELLNLYNLKKDKIEAEIYKGKEGLKTVMNLILKEDKDWISIGSTGKGPSTLPYFLDNWHKQRLKQKIKFKSLVVNNPEGEKRAKEFIKIGLSEIKFLPKEIKNPQTIWIFGNIVAIILISIEEPIIFVINNKEISNSFRDYFNWIWKIAKK